MKEKQFTGNADGISIKSTFQTNTYFNFSWFNIPAKDDAANRSDAFLVLKELKKIEN